MECFEKGIGDSPIVFIHAPIIETIGPEVEILAQVNVAIVAAKEKHMLVTSFHSELTGDTRAHAYFLEMISQSKKEKL
ncbi:type 1 glutamine amidotransferase family protein [Streptococcus vestibularis]|jgi:5'-phosphate synthase pdxT subunit|uniref:Uncharacterized protein n=2 Tax=Streptococcus vestibularis TaxID=1343 RepID=E3CRV7_STRVE|nr:hypothetical protein [Streptococcus vestibularis]EFQ59673.1 hypothetical protein HMPREF9192_1030 [Streptococcus vestibularis F0396]MDU4284900.1 hypothetical protein [Streptococcus sp.]EFX96449.1 hypothetical protein HMPREF9425_0649 [Streptococcus vestibularis ATCC 49124]MBT3132392.1 hypothetical protein [Streptococcus vestibularis]MCB8557277.1 hypothetical protein [Streptococcus vestibularis]